MFLIFLNIHSISTFSSFSSLISSSFSIHSYQYCPNLTFFIFLPFFPSRLNSFALRPSCCLSMLFNVSHFPQHLLTFYLFFLQYPLLLFFLYPFISILLISFFSSPFIFLHPMSIPLPYHLSCPLSFLFNLFLFSQHLLIFSLLFLQHRHLLFILYSSISTA